MKSRRLTALILLLTTGINSPGWGAFASRGSVAIGASVTVGASVTAGGNTLAIGAVPLPATAFFGKSVVIPVQVTSLNGPVNTLNLAVSLMYQLVDSFGAALGPPVNAPITFAASAAAVRPAASTLNGTAMIPAADLEPIRHGGGIQYIFQARQGTTRTLLTQAGIKRMSGNFAGLPSPFQTMIVNSICQTVGPLGARISAPDLFEQDGQTSVTLPPGAIAGTGTLCLKQEDLDEWPAGPGRSAPAAIYSVTLDGAALIQTVELALSYAVDDNGTVMNQHVRGDDLSLFWLGPENLPRPNQSWHVLSRATVDTTLHTVTGFSSHFSTFALFAGGNASTASAIRPTEKIITPNGDPYNPRANFTGLTAQEEVHIFDIRGRRVRTIHGPPHFWDGTDNNGRIVESGVYIYQYTSEGERVSGVIGVAK